MPQISRDFDLGEKPFGPECGAEFWLEHFDRNVAIVFQIAREIHGGHATGAELAVDAITIGERGLQRIRLVNEYHLRGVDRILGFAGCNSLSALEGTASRCDRLPHHAGKSLSTNFSKCAPVGQGLPARYSAIAVSDQNDLGFLVKRPVPFTQHAGRGVGVSETFEVGFMDVP